MYEITIEGRFTAAHRHRAPAELDGRIHGHDFLVRVAAGGETLVEDVLLDFHALERSLGSVLRELSHRELGAHPEFTDREPVPAALARFIHDRLAASAPLPEAVRLLWVEVHDTETTGARYLPSPG